LGPATPLRSWAVIGPRSPISWPNATRKAAKHEENPEPDNQQTLCYFASSGASLRGSENRGVPSSSLGLAIEGRGESGSIEHRSTAIPLSGIRGSRLSSARERMVRQRTEEGRAVRAYVLEGFDVPPKTIDMPTPRVGAGASARLVGQPSRTAPRRSRGICPAGPRATSRAPGRLG